MDTSAKLALFFFAVAASAAAMLVTGQFWIAVGIGMLIGAAIPHGEAGRRVVGARAPGPGSPLSRSAPPQVHGPVAPRGPRRCFVESVLAFRVPAPVCLGSLLAGLAVAGLLECVWPGALAAALVCCGAVLVLGIPRRRLSRSLSVNA